MNALDGLTVARRCPDGLFRDSLIRPSCLFFLLGPSFVLGPSGGPWSVVRTDGRHRSKASLQKAPGRRTAAAVKLSGVGEPNPTEVRPTRMYGPREKAEGDSQLTELAACGRTSHRSAVRP